MASMARRNRLHGKTIIHAQLNLKSNTVKLPSETQRFIYLFKPIYAIVFITQLPASTTVHLTGSKRATFVKKYVYF